MRRILSTKKLSLSQRELLLNANFSLVEYNAITIEVSEIDRFLEAKNAIITSKNAARVVCNSKVDIQNVFCVGVKTASFLKECGYYVVKTTNYATDLAQYISGNYQKENFVFFCGDQRRDELPNILQENRVRFEEKVVYKTTLNLQKVKGEFDGVLFFSPSAVKSFFQENNPKNITAFCIGNTTANEANNYVKDVVVASKPSVENTIVQVVNFFKA